jgi:hypothetical protein
MRAVWCRGRVGEGRFQVRPRVWYAGSKVLGDFRESCFRASSRMMRSFFLWFSVVCAVALSGEVRAAEAQQAPRVSETALWIADLNARWEKAYTERVVEPFKNGQKEARAQYEEQVRLGLADAEKVGDKSSVGVFREELERIKGEGWQIPSTDQDTTLAYLRMSRRFYRERLVELDRDWSGEENRLRLEFDAALVEGVRQLMARNLVEEVRRVQAARQALVSVWLPQVQKRYLEMRPVPAVQVENQTAPAKVRPVPVPQTDAGSRHALVDAVKWVLAGNGKLTVVKAGRKADLARVEDLPRGHVEFYSIELDREKFGRALLPGELRHLAQFRGVQSFELLKFQVGPDELSFLGGWRELRSLTLDGVTVNPQVGRWLSQCDQLQKLVVSHSQGLTAEFFRELAVGGAGLRVLDLTGSEMEDSAALEFSVHRKLVTLNVSETKLTAAIFPALSGLNNLRQLMLFDGPTPGLEQLSALPLEHLMLWKGGDSNFAAQAALLGVCFPKLDSLAFTGRGMLLVEDSEALVTHLKRLRHLSLGYYVTPVPGAAKVLSKLSHLEYFGCSSTGLGDQIFAELLEIRSLKKLNLGHTCVTDGFVSSLDAGKVKGLTGLNLRNTKVTQATVDELSKRIRTLKISLTL